MVGVRAMAAAMDIAQEMGVGIAVVRNSSHFGFGAMFVEQAVQSGMIGMALTNAPSNMPPLGRACALVNSGCQISRIPV